MFDASAAFATVTHLQLLHCVVPWCLSACVSIHHVCAGCTADPLQNRLQSVIHTELSLTTGWPWHYSDGDCLTNKHFRFTSAGCSQCCCSGYTHCIEDTLNWKRKVANTIKSTHWSGKHTLISLQKSYNGRKHNNKVALSLRDFAEYVEQKRSPYDFFDTLKLHFSAQYASICIILILQNSYGVNKYFTEQKQRLISVVLDVKSTNSHWWVLFYRPSNIWDPE